MPKRMIFTLLVMNSVGHNFQGGWRHPEARNRDYKTFDLWVDLARKAERAKFDAFFFTDVLGVQGEYNGSRDIVFEQAMNVPIGDCTMLLPVLAHETSDIGLMYTSSVIQRHPFAFAQQVSTLDQLSGGRVGWNIVTSANERAFANFGVPGGLTHDERYEWAQEYVDVAYKLWEGSWDLGQFPPDTPLEDLLETMPGIQGAFLSLINAWPAGGEPTIRDFLTTMSLPQMVVGSPETIATRLMEFQAAGSDGFQVMNMLMPGSYDDFFDHVVPVLQAKGLMQTEYRPGTLRQKIFETDQPHVNERHPAHRYRGMFS